MTPTEDRLERYAELAVRVGANVQEGQEVFVYGLPEHADLVRALTRQSYKAGASYVNVLYDDQHVRRAMIEFGPDSALTYSPEWRKSLVSSMTGHAMLGCTGNPEPELLADLDGERVGKARQIEVAEDSPAAVRRQLGELVRDRRAERGLGAAGARRARRGAALGARRHMFPARRGRSRRGVAASISRASMRAARRSPSSGPTRSTTAAPAPTSRLGSYRRPSGRAPASRPRAASTSSRTCRPRRSSRRPTRAAPRGRSARRCRCPSPGS